ncbi:MAG: flippase-like domain-containing protein [Anaerolineales bacterium]|nr:flippase-like domain-containing protein [Anaerolineales bacterium]MCA9928849.1 flippase-like domain-containing protein [Anaerolineales bacterium]
MEKAQPVLETSVTKVAKTSMNVKKLILNIFKFVISGGLIFWILRGTNLTEIFDAVRSANFWLVFIAFSMHLLGFTISAYRWRMLLRTRGSDTSILFLVESYIVGMFFNNFLPSTIGGDVYRAYDSWRLGQSKSSALAVVFVDRFLGLLALMLFAFIALLNANELTNSIPYLFVWVFLGVLSMSAFVWLIFMPPRWLPGLIAQLKLPFGKKIHTIIEAFLAFRGQRQVLLKALALSALLQANVVVHYYLIARAMNLPIPLFSFFLIIPLTTVITMLPISVNGIGVRENAYAFFFAAFAVTQPQAVAFAWIAYGMVVLQGVIGGIVYALRR